MESYFIILIICSAVHTLGGLEQRTAIIQTMHGSQFAGRGEDTFLGSITVVVPGNMHGHCCGGHG